MVRRSKLIGRVAELVGPDVVSVVDPLDGWPGLMQVHLPDGDLRASVHVGPVGLSHRDRDFVERRFQNPGQNKPLRTIGDSLPLLLGVWEGRGRPLLVGMEADSRLGKPTRQSLFIPLWLLDHATTTGWAQHSSGSGELIIAFHPALLPTYIEIRRQGLRIQSERLEGIVAASGLTATEDETVEDRVRRASLVLVRSAQFSRAVINAYRERCSMCDLNFGLVEGAHIYPVRAPGSPDATWNGLALCGNHHSAFDRHLLWVDPLSRAIKFHPSIVRRTSDDRAGDLFVASTQQILSLPIRKADFPRAEMFEKRYAFFEDEYSWAL